MRRSLGLWELQAIENSNFYHIVRWRPAQEGSVKVKSLSQSILSNKCEQDIKQLKSISNYYFQNSQLPSTLNQIPYKYLKIKNMRLNEHNAATSVYLQQISNHIQIGEGYSQLRKHLFRELHQLTNGDMVSDDRLSDSIVSYLATAIDRTVKFHRSAQTYRILQIIEDLLTYAEEVMTPAMHTEHFVSELKHIANPKIVTFDSKTDSDCRNHALGIFLFWFDRYGRDEECSYELFIQGYKDLKDKKMLFPNEITIKPSDFFKKQLQKQKNAPKPPESNESKTNRIILEDIEDFTVKTQSLFKENFKTIATTEYVRLIKHKSKVLFEFTSKPNDFKDKEKNLVKDLYKRLRVILKELDKYKETSLQTKKSSETEKQFVEAKMTPKKAPPIEISPQVVKVQATPEKKSSQVKNQYKTPKASENIDLLDMGPVTKIESKQKTPERKVVSNKKPEQVLNVDLLNDNPKTNATVQEQEQFVEGIIVTNTQTQKQSKQQAALFQVFSTPKKQVHEEDGVLLAKQASNNSQDLSPAFDNEKMGKNPYSFIPDHLNLTPTSSIQDDEQKVQEKPIFSLFGLLNPNKPQNKSPETFEEEPQHYDSIHKKGKKFSEETPKKVEQIINQQAPKAYQIKDIVHSPNYKPVMPVNYEIYANFISQSPQKEDEQTKFELTPKKKSNQQLKQAEFSSPKSAQKIKQQEQ